MYFFCQAGKCFDEEESGIPNSKSQIEDGGENRTRTCKPLRAVVFKTTALANYAISP